ncbi:MAG: phosphopyruvate hydratase [Patescibacteria group bacterium]|nr:phosphopyruvate hydratase [Patescibacteria group bacterium]
MADATIQKIVGREILDSRGNPTVSVTVVLSDGTAATAAVPSGASTGVHEAHELRDGDAKRYGGSGVLRAVANVNGPIATALRGTAVRDVKVIDQRLVTLDGTPNKSKLGANAILGVSMAVVRAAAASARQPLYRFLRSVYFPGVSGWRLPTPMCNIMNGGAHANWSIDVQEFMVLPQQQKVNERIRCGAEIFHVLGKLLKKKRLPTTVGDEGGFAPRLSGNEAALKLVCAAVGQAGYRLGTDVRLGLDVAASGLYQKGKYRFKTDGKTYRAEQLVELYRRWTQRYPLATIEDGMAEDDWEGWKVLTTELKKSTTLIGDDLFVTNTERLQQGIQREVANAILIKPNQVGTVSETAAAINLARQHRYQIAVSHRSGETCDDFITDLAVAANAEYLKAGSFSRGERMAKWNRLMEIAAEVEGTS